ncbi:MAG: class I SAM-dependent methyltransferase [Betaproteobacteria bacterium]
MIPQLDKLLQAFENDSDGIYFGLTVSSAAQSTEIELRERVAAEHYDDYLAAVSRSHSIPVMDCEVDRFLAGMPPNALILDVGGCWGWHWRRLSRTRPDVAVLIVDFVRSNLPHARNVLGDLVGHQVGLMHADATALPFSIDKNFTGFDGVWTVQTFQHIPDFDKAVSEAHRVLKSGGGFVNYSLNVQPHLRWLCRLLDRRYVTEDWIEGAFWLARASGAQKACIEAIFGNAVSERWSEILYSPELRFSVPGKEGSLLGKLDALLSNNVGFLGWLARQRSFQCEKP